MIDKKNINEEKMLKEINSYHYTDNKDVEQLKEDLKKMLKLENDVCKIRDEFKNYSFSEIYNSKCDEYMPYILNSPY
uniref:Uncharacterized protein n=1 Tax=viral metagenome TaxID=1070528 RepID=A0A6C0ACN2_9ZZZZ